MQSLAVRTLERIPKTSQWQLKSTFSHSAPAHRALPFSLDSLHAKATSEREHGKVLRMVMFGKPSAGKGTLSARLVRKYDIMTLSTGDLLRQHITERTEVGRQAEEIVARGGLLPDELMFQVLTSKLDTLHNRHWILDGFPRTLVQGKMLDAHLKKQGTPLSLVVNLDVPDDIILSRISDRWVHLPSGRVYNLSYNRPKVEGLDDITGEPLTRRPDDNPEIFARRLKAFYASTSPLLDYYAQQSPSPSSFFTPKSSVTPESHSLQLETLKGVSSDEIWPKLEEVVSSSFPSLKERQELKKRHSLSDAMVADSDRSKPKLTVAAMKK